VRVPDTLVPEWADALFVSGDAFFLSRRVQFATLGRAMEFQSAALLAPFTNPQESVEFGGLPRSPSGRRFV
jgi:hypothetical protein